MYLKIICKHEIIDMFLFVSFVIFCSNYVKSIPEEEFYNPGLQGVEVHETTTKGPTEESKLSTVRFHRLSRLVKKLSKKNKTTPIQRTIEVNTNAVPSIVEAVTITELPINNDISNSSNGWPQLDKHSDGITEVITESTTTASTDSMANKVQAVITNAVKEGQRMSSNAKGTISKVGQKVSQKVSGTLNSGVSKITGRVCFKHIGCFASYDDYSDVFRQPTSLLPMSPDLIDCTFNMFSTKKGSIPRSFKYDVTSDDLLKSSFDPNFKTVVITHGYRNGFEPWIRNMKESIVNQTKDYNIIIVIWEKGAKLANYYLAATNTRVVGASIAFFLTNLVKTFNYTNDKFHLIGHSLGGHAVGLAAKLLNNPKVHRVTGLDPSGAGINLRFDAMHLHYTDATIVDVFHTDIGMGFSESLGTETKLGYYDFYPNGGLLQPGCRAPRNKLNVLNAFSGEEIPCSHSRAYRYGISVGLKPWTECQPIGYMCEDYGTFIEGRCFDCTEDRCQPMGLNFDYWLSHKPDPIALNYKYYLNLAPNEEFCVYHYQFGFHVTQDSDEATGLLDFNLKIKNQKNTKVELTFEKIMSDILQGEVHTLLMTFQFKLDDIVSMTIQWKRLDRPQDKHRVNKGKVLKIPIIEINYMSHLNKSERDVSSFILCPDRGADTEIRPNNKKIEFIVCNPKEMLEMSESAKQLVAEILVPLTAKEDLYSNDYEGLNSVVQKIPNSNLQEKSFLG